MSGVPTGPSRSGARIAAILLALAMAAGGVSFLLGSATATPSGGPALSPDLGIPSPRGIAYDPTLSELFVTDYGVGTVSVVADATRTLVATVAVGSEPFAAAYDPANGEVYVSDFGSASVSVISGANNSVVGTIPVGENPAGIAYDPAAGELFVVNYGAATVSVINDTNDSVVASIATRGDPTDAVYAAPLAAVFVTENVGWVSEISPLTNSIVTSRSVGGDPYGLAYDVGTGQLFVTEYDGYAVAVLNASSLAPVATVEVHAGPVAAAYVPGTNLVFVADTGLWLLDVLRDTNDFLGATVSLHGEPTAIAFDPGTGELVVSEQNVGQLLFLAPSTVVVGSGVPPGSTPSEAVAAEIAAGAAVLLVGAGIVTGVVSARGSKDVLFETTEAPGRRRRDATAFALLATGAAVGAGGSTYAWLAAAGTFGGLGSTSANVAGDGVTVGASSGAIALLLVVGAIGAGLFALFLLGFWRLRASEPRLALPGVLVWFGLAGLPLVVGGLVVVLDGISAASACAGTLDPIPARCFPAPVALLAIDLVALGVLGEVVGVVGLILGLLRAGETFGSRPLASGGLLLGFGLFVAVAMVALGVLYAPSFASLAVLVVPFLALVGFLTALFGAARAHRKLGGSERIADLA